MKNKKTIVYTAGTWDLFHVGHLNLLRESRKYGDVLIVGVNTDELIEIHKFKKPIYTFEERLAIIKACKYVDKAVKQTILDDPEMMKEYNVDILTVGSDWKNRDDIPGLNWMRKNRKVVYIPYTDGVSSTDIKNRIKKPEYEREYIRNGFLVGKSIYLRPLEKEDIKTWYTWFNDPAVTQHLKHGVFPNTYEKQERFLETIYSSNDIIQLAIIEKNSKEIIGVTSIRQIDWVCRSGGIGITIGKKDYRNKGIGLEAIGLMLYHGFYKMGLHRIWTEQSESLRRVSNAWQRNFGFRIEGIEKDAIFAEGKYCNYTLMAVLADEFSDKMKEEGGFLKELIE